MEGHPHNSVADIIALLLVGITSLAFFVVWERFLERTSEKAKSAAKTALSLVHQRSRWTPPPLLRPSLLTRARGRLAALFLIALLNNASFLAWQFWAQLYYQTYLGLNPLQTMLRLLPMFVSAVLADVFVAYVVGRVDVMPLIGTLTPPTFCPEPPLTKTTQSLVQYAQHARHCSLRSSPRPRATGHSDFQPRP
jgi:hypothetical protein